MSQRRSARKPSPADLLTIGEATKLLGVSQPTLCRWDELGKFPGRRHRLNGYRRWTRAEVMNLRKPLIEGERAA